MFWKEKIMKGVTDSEKWQLTAEGRALKTKAAFSYLTRRKAAPAAPPFSMGLKGITLLLQRIEIDLDEVPSRGDSLFSSAVQPLSTTVSKSFYQYCFSPFPFSCCL